MNADRRQVLRLAALAAFAPLVMPATARALTNARFAPPSGPMRYTRRLERALGDGAIFAVTRSFAIRFIPVGGGFRVEGEQVDVSVDAPDKLAEFAKIERERREQGLFPLMLDRQGLIFGARMPIRTVALDAAVKEAMGEFDREALSAGERAERVHFVNALHQSASRLVTELPQDLFAPTEASRDAERDISLPDGESGAVTVRFTASADPLTGVMRQATREVVTALSNDRRRTVESWALGPL